jgi:hypothetical protein
MVGRGERAWARRVVVGMTIFANTLIMLDCLTKLLTRKTRLL